MLLIGGFVAVAFGMSGARVSRDSSALAQVEIDSFGGEVERAVATDAKGKEIPVTIHGDKIVPSGKLHPGEKVKLEVTIKRPSTVGWLAGGTEVKTMTLTTPKADLDGKWIAVSKQTKTPHVEVQAAGDERQPTASRANSSTSTSSTRTARSPSANRPSAGSVIIAAAPRAWQKVGKFKTVTWFPAGGSPTVIANPPVGTEISPSTPLELTISKKIKKVLGGKDPELDPDVPGKWTQVNPHTIRFTPTGFGAPMDVELEAKLPEKVEVVQADGSVKEASTVAWTVPARQPAAAAADARPARLHAEQLEGRTRAKRSS